MIGVDWGTSSFRAYRLTPDGHVIDKTTSPTGILFVEGGRFADVLRRAILPWVNAGERRVLLSGMIGSRQGWIEAPYLPCPAGAADLAAATIAVPFNDAEVRLVPGVTAEDAGVPEVMRGEETQIIGTLRELGPSGVACLPGSHAKWVRVENGRIMGFSTFMTGEAFAAFSGHTILGRMMKVDAPADPAALRQGLARSADAGGLLRHLFGVRTLGLFGRLSEDSAASYLSGLLLGHEVRAALAAHPDMGSILLIGDAKLCALYADAIAFCGGSARIAKADAAPLGLTAIAAAVAWH
ncbi:2-dehydro-3-deoxygalactonokinase [Acidisoma cladoniae]|jgi:2-dehydro-3-deoxygalactonokinase|uniref:2-dehydro-3-deoxygalactonokinase n=1 Tax=Acidisoma cladoniae TaxID=3040935 RepID=UPI00254FF9D6|nr:2-dehydro-3-deoxygalactonokinase [Acidisoma sp. PAMC 29798]